MDRPATRASSSPRSASSSRESCWLIRAVPDHACWAPISTHAPRLTTEDREVWLPLVKRSTVPLPRPVRGIRSRDPFQCKIIIASDFECACSGGRCDVCLFLTASNVCPKFPAFGGPSLAQGLRSAHAW
jgi:hypothetical protein